MCHWSRAKSSFTWRNVSATNAHADAHRLAELAAETNAVARRETNKVCAGSGSVVRGEAEEVVVVVVVVEEDFGGKDASVSLEEQI